MQFSVQLINSLLHADEHIKSSELQFNKQSTKIDSHSSHCFDPLDGYSLQSIVFGIPWKICISSYLQAKYFN